ncbi:hypothetical protein GXW83_12535 [Streptacidiphilus sp. PB12-B1b]|uniref:RNase A-like domain-containing protein n=1 Tax=Streptacidiphilus sp. PB12-B1b TaxID=2705012 RepID=UPI0015FB1444|nr:RNase A-like domain-containing protein [Streptacidiphilus sp. PB12-B1b]QMU76443.1 hypothetical protein GXW83_12535 [Streptacidiphilus sp. PB12-B1b]
MTVLRASSFSSASAAQTYVQRVVDRNRDRIAQWLESGPGDRLVLQSHFAGEVTGRLLPVGMVLAGRGPVEVSSVRVLLQRDSLDRGRFTVRSAYPTED